MRAIRLLALHAIAMAGCGATLADGDQPSTASPEGPTAVDAATPPPVDAAASAITATAFITQYGDMQCGEAFTCEASYPAGAAATFADSWGPSVAACDANALAYYNPTKVELDIAKGRIAYDPSAAAACLAGIVFGTCTNFWQTYGSYPDACVHALVGSVANGGGCVTDFECASLYCTSTAKCADAP